MGIGDAYADKDARELRNHYRHKGKCEHGVDRCPDCEQLFVTEKANAAAEARLAAVEECKRHAAFCKSEWDKGGDAAHLSARYDEANYLAQRIADARTASSESEE